MMSSLEELIQTLEESSLGCDGQDVAPADFITRAGTYRLFAGELEVTVTAGDSGTSYSLSRTKAGARGGELSQRIAGRHHDDRGAISVPSAYGVTLIWIIFR